MDFLRFISRRRNPVSKEFWFSTPNQPYSCTRFKLLIFCLFACAVTNQKLYVQMAAVEVISREAQGKWNTRQGESDPSPFLSVQPYHVIGPLISVHLFSTHSYFVLHSSESISQYRFYMYFTTDLHFTAKVHSLSAGKTAQEVSTARGSIFRLTNLINVVDNLASGTLIFIVYSLLFACRNLWFFLIERQLLKYGCNYQEIVVKIHHMFHSRPNLFNFIY